MATRFANVCRVYYRPSRIGYKSPPWASVFREIASDCNALLARGRWHVATIRTLDPANDTTAPTFATDQWITKITIGPATETLRIVFLVQPGAASGSIQWDGDTGTLIEFGPGTSEQRIGQLEERVVDVDVSASQGTEIDVLINVSEELMLKAWAIYDKAPPYIGTADGAVDLTPWRRGAVAISDHLATLIAAQQGIVDDLAREIVNCASLNVPLADMTPETTWANAFDSTYTDIDANAPGFFVSPGPAWEGATVVRLVVRVRCSVVDGTGYVVAAVSGTTGTPGSVSTTLGWVTSTLDLPIPADWSSGWEEHVQIFAAHETPQDMLITAVVINEADLGEPSR